MATAAEQTSSLLAAMPFFLTALLLLLGSVLSLLAISRLCTEYERIIADAKVPAQHRTIELKPRSLAEMGNWLIDGAGLVTSMTGPVLGLLLLYDRISGLAAAIYALLILIWTAGFALFVTKVPPSGYPNRRFGLHVRGMVIGPRPVWIFSPMTMIALALNLSLGVIVVAFNP